MPVSGDVDYIRNLRALLILADELPEVAQPHSPALPPQHIAIAEQHERWHRLNVVVHRETLILIHIELDDTNAIPELILQLLENRVHHLTRTAPGSIEVNQRQLAAVDDLIEFLHFTSPFYIIICSRYVMVLQIYGKKSE